MTRLAIAAGSPAGGRVAPSFVQQLAFHLREAEAEAQLGAAQAEPEGKAGAEAVAAVSKGATRALALHCRVALKYGDSPQQPASCPMGSLADPLGPGACLRAGKLIGAMAAEDATTAAELTAARRQAGSSASGGSPAAPAGPFQKVVVESTGVLKKSSGWASAVVPSSLGVGSGADGGNDDVLIQVPLPAPRPAVASAAVGAAILLSD